MFIKYVDLFSAILFYMKIYVRLLVNFIIIIGYNKYI